MAPVIRKLINYMWEDMKKEMQLAFSLTEATPCVIWYAALTQSFKGVFPPVRRQSVSTAFENSSPRSLSPEVFRAIHLHYGSA